VYKKFYFLLLHGTQEFGFLRSPLIFS